MSPDPWLGLLALLPVAGWLLLLLDPRRRWPREGLPERPEPSREPVVVVVPARDEAALLPLTLPSLLGQDHQQLEVVLVDDHSSDGTAETARELAAGHPGGHRLVVLAAAPRPPEWSGKLWALQQGVEWAAARQRPWLLFVDADVELAPDTLTALLSRAGAGGRDLVSVMARLSAEGSWERLLVPPFVFFFHLLYPFRLVAREGSRVAAAAGGCLLVARPALDRAGGLAAVRGAVIDDVAVGRAAQRGGGRLWLGFDRRVVSHRRYRHLGELWRMVARTAFVQLGHRWSLLAATLAALLLFVVAPPVVAVAAAGAGSWPATVAALAGWLLQAVAVAPAVRQQGVGLGWTLTLPLAGLLYAGMTASAAWDHLRGRGSRWKGRSYPGSR